MTVLSSKGPRSVSSRVSMNHAKNIAGNRSKAVSAKPRPGYKTNLPKKSRGSLEGLVRKRDAVLEHGGTGYSAPSNQKARFRSNRLNTSVNYGKINGGTKNPMMHHTDITMRPRRNR